MSRVATQHLFAFPSIMAHDGLAPPLALSDILHTLSPSPAPQQSSNQPSTARPPSPPRSPEPLNQTQIDSMRDRVLEIRGQGDNTVGLSSRETELVNMVSHGSVSPPFTFRTNSARSLRSCVSHMPVYQNHPRSWNKQIPSTSSHNNANLCFMKLLPSALGGQRRGTVLRE